MSHILGRYEENAGKYYQAMLDNAAGYEGMEIRKMSRLTCNFLRAIDYEKGKKQREKNYALLSEPVSYTHLTQQYSSEGSGSGIIVGENDDELLIATNNHVVDGATTLSVCFAGNDVVNAEAETVNMSSESDSDGDVNVEDAVSAKIKGTDETNDLAVVAVQKSDIPEDTLSQIKIAQLGDSDSVEVGEQVVAIGNALGYGQSVTSGWISALNRSISTSDGTTSDGLIQTDAAINPGNRGGALDVYKRQPFYRSFCLFSSPRTYV